MDIRTPIVTVLGHVDHGKTTLLDTLRSTSLAAREAGGITQAIGASVLEIKGKKIIFIDTPGHAAFNSMRREGAKIADLALLVVAADDGPKPQTIEALEYIRKAGIPFILTLTKIDLPSANIDKALGEMEKLGVLFEGRGGATPVVEVSAKEKKGIDNLLEMIMLMAEISELKGEASAELDAVVFESYKGKAGPVASVAVKNGSLKIGDQIKVGEVSGKIKSLITPDGERVDTANPGTAVSVLGFSELPKIGGKIALGKGAVGVSNRSSDIHAKIGEDELAVLIKGGTSGALDALITSLPEKAKVVGKSVGEVTDADIFFAKSAGAKIFVFNVNVPSAVKKLAKTESVTIEEFDIIYKLLERIDEILKSKEILVLGRATVLAIFPFNNKKIAGCKIEEGEFKKGVKVTLIRGNKELGEGKIISLRKQKSEVEVVKSQEECGILLAPQLDFEVGDVITSTL